MELSKEKGNGFSKKIIPWHVQKRYMESLSQLSLNQTIATAFYKKKINSLQRNNKHLALALQQNRYLATEKENLLIDNGKIMDIINFSRLKLMDMAVNMKQATECLDETLLLLNSSISDNLSKNSPNSVNYRNDLKSKLQELSKNSPIREVSESSEKYSKSCSKKGKISRVDDYISSPNKRSKLTKNGKNVKRKGKDVLKSAKRSAAVPSIGVKDTSVKSSKKTEAGNKEAFLDKKRKDVQVILTDIAEDFVSRETENYHSPKKNKLVSSTNNSNLRYCTENSPEDIILINNFFSSEISSKQKSLHSSSLNSLSVINEINVQNIPQNTLNSSSFSHKNLPSSKNIPENNNKHSVPSFKKNGNFSIVVKKETSEEIDNNFEQNYKMIESSNFEKDKTCNKSQNSKVINRMQFYFDEDAIEKVETGIVSSKDKVQKSINKCKTKKTFVHEKKTVSFNNSTVKSNFKLPDNISKLGKNSFLVTAEVHSPLNGICAKRIKSNISVSEKKEPCVVLTDIFKSNQDLLSEMIRKNLHENRCLQNAVTDSTKAPLTFTVNDLNMDLENNAVNEDHIIEDGLIRKMVFCEEKTGGSDKYCVKQPTIALQDIINSKKACNKSSKANSNEKENFELNLLLDKENRILPEDKEIIRKREHRSRAKKVSYKEPSLHVKMRRLF